MVNVGVIGLSEGNGHPFSFSSIINGFDEECLKQAGWDVIYQYMRERDKSEFGISGVQVTHAWTQDPEITRKLCAACRIPHAVQEYKEMLDHVDALIIARDDYESHLEMAMPFLKKGISVFIDKPLTLSMSELSVFKLYLETGQLMSCSSMRYAKELDKARVSISSYGKVKLIRGAIVNDWEKYGIHMLDAIYPLLRARCVSVTAQFAHHSSVSLEMDDGSVVQIDALGRLPKVFQVDIYGSELITTHEIKDNFTMFRRMLWHFFHSVKTGVPAIACEETMDVLKILYAGQQALMERRRIRLDEVEL